MKAVQIFRYLLLRLFPMVLFAAVPGNARATHIVGGELNYRYLGNDSLYVKIKVYRDSLNADPYFDSPLSLYVYDNSNNFVRTYLIPLPDEADIIPAIDDSCFVEPPLVLVDFVIYEDTLYIPGITTGYTLAYMRCCRNNAILNIEAIDFITGVVVPGELTGAIYPAEIPDLTLDNGNPEYNTFPPVLICANKPLRYDHSATDPDGDSLAYELCTPYTGGNATFVFGDPVLQEPPFQEVLFIPPFSLENVMGGVPLRIHPQTGLLTAVPNTLGRFVIAVCVNEYRDGQFLARHRRDFQFNVVDCSRVFDANFDVSPAPKIDTLTPFDYLFCDTTLTKQFTAVLVEPIPVFWDFGDGTTSNQTNPVHTFPDTGRYDVMIVAGPGEICADTLIKTIRIQRHIIGAAFEFDPDACGVGAAAVSFLDASTASEPIVQWQWDFGDGQVSEEQNPIHYFEEADTFEVSLIIYASNGCCTSTDAPVITTLIDSIYLPDTLAACGGDSVLIALDAGDGALDFAWSPALGLSDPDVQQPLAFPERNTQYVVTIRTLTEAGDTCARSDTCVVLVEDIIPAIDIVSDTVLCSQDVTLLAVTDFDQPVEWLWSSNPEFSDTLSTIKLLETVQQENEATYYVQASSYWCRNSESITIRRNFINIIPEIIIRCGDEPAAVNFEVVTPSTDYTITWTFNDTVFVANEPYVIDLDNPGVEVLITATNAEGCSDETRAQVKNLPLPDVVADAAPREVVSGQSVDLAATDDADYSYAWTPSAGLSDPAIANPVAEVFETTIFEVVVVDEQGCSSTDTALVVVVDVQCDEGNVFIPNAFSPNGDGLNDVFRPSGERIEAMDLEIYDRWGNKIFEGDDLERGWDGTADGKPLSSDSYGYLMRILCAGQAVFEKKGNVTLVR